MKEGKVKNKIHRRSRGEEPVILDVEKAWGDHNPEYDYDKVA
jgi:hypothetical protein